MGGVVEWVGDVFSDIGDFFFGCGDCCVGNTRESSKSDKHAKKVADELAEIKTKESESAKQQEKKIIDSIDESMDMFLENVKDLNQNIYGGKSLNINIDLIMKRNEELKNQVVGCIGDVINKRLVQTDKELSLILQEHSGKKRKKSFQIFVDKIRGNAIKEFKKKVENTVNQQSEMVRKEIDTRLNEVNKSMEESIQAYTDIFELKQKNSQELEEMQIACMYRVGLSELLLDEVESF